MTDSVFALSAFEIHGTINVKEDCQLKLEEEIVGIDEGDFDPYDLPEFDG
jgi:hypothetical protein